MRRTIRSPASALLVALMTASAPILAEDAASLPEGFKAESGPKVTGVYAYAMSSGMNSGLEDSLSAIGKICIARGRVVEYAGDTGRRTQTIFWLYRHGTETAVFRSDIKATLDADQCRVTFGEERKVLRSAHKPGAWPSPFSARRLKCSGSPSPCHSTTMFGIKARCRAEGDSFNVFRDCVSNERGPTRGMLLESGFASDDMSGYGFSVLELKTAASIDASVFDPSRTW